MWWHLAAGGEEGATPGEVGVHELGAVRVRVEGHGALAAGQGLAKVQAAGLGEPVEKGY